ncbi:MAG: hypothetical protein JO262_19110 [Solirubrobacterales bacterium]|nr:hypothetical protein [Solirubrobacterales bacterium]
MDGSPAARYPADFGTAIGSSGATAPTTGRSFKTALAVHRRVAMPRRIPPVVPYAPPSTKSPLPIGGGAAAAGSGGFGSAAPPVAPAFTAFVLALAMILLARFCLDLSSWRSRLLPSGLERPG